MRENTREDRASAESDVYKGEESANSASYRISVRRKSGQAGATRVQRAASSRHPIYSYTEYFTKLCSGSGKWQPIIFTTLVALIEPQLGNWVSLRF